MKRYQMIVFFTIALTIYSLVNIYIFYKGYKAVPGIQNHRLLYIITCFLLAVLFIVAKILESKGISAEIINIHTIKPLDDAAILQSVNKTKCVVTAEEHMMNGGMGDSIAQLLARCLPSPMEMVAVNDKFGESGIPEELMVKFGLDTPHIVEAALRAIARKA